MGYISRMPDRRMSGMINRSISIRSRRGRRRSRLGGFLGSLFYAQLLYTEVKAAVNKALKKLLKKDIARCAIKMPSVIKRDSVDISSIVAVMAEHQYSQGWHCYKSSNNGPVYVYMLATGERRIIGLVDGLLGW